MDVYERESPQGVVLSVGGQAANNIAMALFRQNVKVFIQKKSIRLCHVTHGLEHLLVFVRFPVIFLFHAIFLRHQILKFGMWIVVRSSALLLR
jgi:hypothetical protein